MFTPRGPPPGVSGAHSPYLTSQGDCLICSSMSFHEHHNVSGRDVPALSTSSGGLSGLVPSGEWEGARSS